MLLSATVETSSYPLSRTTEYNYYKARAWDLCLTYQ